MGDLSVGLYRGRTDKALFICENIFGHTGAKKDMFDWLNFFLRMMIARMVELGNSYPNNWGKE